MKTIDKILWSILLPLLFSLGGCHSSNQTTKESRFENFEVQNMTLNSIEDVQKKYQIDQAQRNLNNAKSEDEISIAKASLASLLNGLSSVGEAVADGSNEDDPIDINSGRFYTITVHCKSPKAYNEKLTFDFTLTSLDEEDSYSKIIGTVQTDDINSSEEFDVILDTQIPGDIKSGKYLLVSSIMNQDDNYIEESNMSKISKAGFIYLSISNNHDSKHITLTTVTGSKYIDLPYLTTYDKEYSNSDAQKSSLVVYNSSTQDENVTISAVLKLASGEETHLGILDTSDGVIKDKIEYTVPSQKEDSVKPIDITVSYYIPKDTYKTIINAIPDLSESTVDEAKGTIVWSITSKNSKLVTNSIEAKMLLSKYVDDFDMVKNNGKESQEKNTFKTYKRNRLFSPHTQFIRYNKDNDESQDGWQNISTISNLTFTTIDAALDYSGEEAFLFSGDKYVIYNKNSHSVSEIKKISERWIGITFDHIDAAFQADGYFFLFSGNEYIKTDHWNKMYSGYPKRVDDSTWKGLSKLKTIDSAVDYYDNRIYFFGKDFNDQPAYIRFNWNNQSTDNGYPREINGHWNQFRADVSACFYDQYPNVICFKNGGADRELLNKGIFFKYDGKYNKVFGNKDNVGFEVNTNYASIGRWDVPGVEGNIKVNTEGHLYNHRFNILNIKAEASVALDAKYDKKGYQSNNNKSRTGSKLEVTVFGGKIFDKGQIDEVTVDKKITKSNAQSFIDGKSSSTKFITMPMYEWSRSKDILSQYFYVGGIPIRVSMGISGEMQINLKVGIEGVGIKLKAVAPANLSIYIKGGVNIGWAEAGVGGDIKMIDVSGETSIRSGLTLTPDENLAFNLDFDSRISLRILRGSTFLYAQVRRWRSRRRSYRCCYRTFYYTSWSTYWKEYRKYLYCSPWLYERTWKLLEKEFNLYTIELN